MSQVTNKQMGQSSNKRKKITLKQKECRCLLAQMKSAENAKQSQFQVAELFSPPSFSLEVEKHGGKGLAFDIKQGWDLLNPKTQEQVDRLLDKACPELLVVCPTCTHSGGWEKPESVLPYATGESPADQEKSGAPPILCEANS